MDASVDSYHLKLYYKRPYSDVILTLMEDNALLDADNLLNNIEKVLPVSTLLNGKNSKRITKVSYEQDVKGLFFHLYIN